MKRLFTTILSLMIPLAAQASLQQYGTKPLALSYDLVPAQFSSSSETTTMEWGCPVSEVVEALNQAEAMHKIKLECMEEARQAAISRPNVLDVIQTSVIWPDVQVQSTDRGYQLSGTFFLETLVLQKARP